VEENNESLIRELDESVNTVQNCEKKLKKSRDDRDEVIKRMVNAGFTYRKIAVRAGVSPTHVGDVVNGQN